MCLHLLLGTVIIKKDGQDDREVKEGDFFGATDLAHGVKAREETAICKSKRNSMFFSSIPHG